MTQQKRFLQILCFLFALGGNIFLAWVFWRAPGWASLEAIILQNGPLVVVIEFLAIYAGGITSGKQVEAERNFEGRELPSSPQKRRVLLLGAFVLVGLFAGWFLQHLWLAVFFTASLLTKYFAHRAARTRPLTVITIIWFLASLSTFIVTQSLSEVMLRWWGIVYFTVSVVTIFSLFVVELKNVSIRKTDV